MSRDPLLIGIKVLFANSESETMIDITNEKMLAQSKVPNWCEKYLGHKVNRSTVFRWSTRGARGKKLETILVGGRRFTSEEALIRFFNRATEAQDGGAIAQPCHVQTKGKTAAELYLESEGL